MYNTVTDNNIIWGYENNWTRSASSGVRTISPDVPMQTLIWRYLYIIEHMEVSD